MKLILKKNRSDGEETPLKSLKAIQGWVGSFFSCSGCRRHFMHMTTEQFPLTEAQANIKINYFK
jgi:hypothetical protein